MSLRNTFENIPASHDINIDVPLFRWGCTLMALTMTECGFDVNIPDVTYCVETAKNVPFPEVRHANALLVLSRMGMIDKAVLSGDFLFVGDTLRTPIIPVDLSILRDLSVRISTDTGCFS